VPEEQITLEDLSASEDLPYQEYLVMILETSERVTQNKKIKICKVQSSHHTKAKATCEREEELKAELLSKMKMTMTEKMLPPPLLLPPLLPLLRLLSRRKKTQRCWFWNRSLLRNWRSS
jgi:ribosomal protein L35